MPLWEGFDEPFHYGYVQSLSATHHLPLVHRTPVSQEIRESLRLVPVSWLLHNSLPGSISFEEWFRLSAAQRDDRLAALARLSHALQSQSSSLLNYEAQQAPLAYILLSPIDAAVSQVPLRPRIFALRLAVAIVSSVCLFFAVNLLLRALSVNGPFRIAALACLFESQMLWASIAHIGNDWLAIPLSTSFLALLVVTAKNSRPGFALAMAAALAAGLLTKAYFLAFVPVFAAFLIARFAQRRLNGRTAFLAASIVLFGALWYVRNIVLYRSLSGTQESIAGVSLPSAAGAFLHINWLTSTIDLFRWALWTGNWSFVSFSRFTLNAELILVAAAFVLFFTSFREITAGEWWALLACAAFFLGLIYQTCVTWVATNGQSRHAEPWYLQCILPCLWMLVFLALQRHRTIGRILAAAILLISAWIAAATYLLKLIPLYGGFLGRSTIPKAYVWWRHLPAYTLSQTLLGPQTIMFGALAAFLLLLAALNIALLRRLLAWRQPH
ncbi:MAG TPA: hypothetical protein VHU83_21655 [Bryobacteraceae bacterium]|nr:hypothetical protein [Bryobacteraceae bacterium]